MRERKWRLGFGKYRMLTLKEIAITDLGYLIWLIDNKIELSKENLQELRKLKKKYKYDIESYRDDIEFCKEHSNELSGLSLGWDFWKD